MGLLETGGAVGCGARVDQPDAQRPVAEEVPGRERDHVPAFLDRAVGPAGQVGHDGRPPADEHRERVGPQHEVDFGQSLAPRDRGAAGR